MSHRFRPTLRIVAIVFALGASVFTDSAIHCADAAGGRSGGGGRGGMRAGGIRSGGHLGGHRGHAMSVGAAGGWRGSRGHRSHSFRAPFARSHKFRHRSTAFVNVTGLVSPFYSYYPYHYPPYPSYGYDPYYSPYPAYSAPYDSGYSSSAYPVAYPQSAGTYAYGASDNVQVYVAPPEPPPPPTAPMPERSSPQQPPGDGSVNLQVSPPEAKVVLDGRYIGEAHEVARIAEIPVAAGRHLLEIRVGAERTFMDVVVSPGRTTPVRLTLDASGDTPATLHPEDGVLRLQASPGGAAIYVNGAFAGIAAATEALALHLPSGRHRVQIVLPGYKGYDGTVAVPERGPAILAVQLAPE